MRRGVEMDKSGVSPKAATEISGAQQSSTFVATSIQTQAFNGRRSYKLPTTVTVTVHLSRPCGAGEEVKHNLFLFQFNMRKLKHKTFLESKIFVYSNGSLFFLNSKFVLKVIFIKRVFKSYLFYWKTLQE